MRRILFFIFLLFLFIIEAKSFALGIHAKSAILYNPDNGAVIYQKNANQPHYPASITKIATALFVLEQKNISLDDKFVATKRALKVLQANIKQADPMEYPPHVLEHDGVIAGLVEGKSYSFNTLLHALLLMSANDAANVIAENCSGSISQFMAELNSYLRKLGIKQTQFMNPHGLHHPAQMTTALEMAKIAAHAFQNEKFCQVIKTPFFEHIDLYFKSGRKIVNQNRLLQNKRYAYSKFLGGKTGYISKSRFNLVAAAEDNGRRLIAVLLGCEANEDRYKDAIHLFETAFREKPKKRLLFKKGEDRFIREMPEASASIEAGLNEDIEISYFPSEESELSAQVVWQKQRFPILPGKQVGKVEVKDQRGNVLASRPIFSLKRIEKTFFTKSSYFLRKHKISTSLGLAGCLFFFGFLQTRKKRSKIRKR